MKAILNLSFEDGLKVAEALRNVALESGWEADELYESGVIVEYARVVDAALSAMGFEVRIDNAPSVEEDDFDEEEYDEDEDFEDCDDDDDDEDAEYDDSCQYSLTVKGEFVLRYMEAGYSFEEACEVADILFNRGDGE